MLQDIDKCPICNDVILSPNERGLLRANDKYVVVWLLLSDNTRMRVALCKKCSDKDIKASHIKKMLDNTKRLWKLEAKDGKITQHKEALQVSKFAKSENELIKDNKYGN